MSAPAVILLGTVAIEPQRWAGYLPGQPAPGANDLVRVSAHLDRIAGAGFDGVEVWERHLTEADATEVEAVLRHELPVTVFNSYVSLDDPDPGARHAVAEWARRTDSSGVKFNIGNDPEARAAYVERIAQWLAELPDTTALLCECHHGISIAEDPAVAAAIFDAAGPPSRLQAIVHTHEDPDHIRARFDAYGDRIRHVHVNFLDFENLGAPRLVDIRARVESQVELLRGLGFAGSWTIEFCHGVLTENDTAPFLLEEAAADLGLLRELLQ